MRASVTVTPTAGVNTSIGLSTSVAECNARTCVASGTSGGSGAADQLVWLNNTGNQVNAILTVDSSVTANGAGFTIVAFVDSPPARLHRA